MKKEIKYIRDGRAPVPQKELTSKIMSKNKAKDTKPELILRKGLWKEGIRGYRLHWKKAPGTPDIAFPKKKIAIFVNGCYWHRCPHCKLPLPKSNTAFWRKKFERNTERDKTKIEELRSEGWTPMTIWECEIKLDLPGCLIKINDLTDQ